LNEVIYRLNAENSFAFLRLKSETDLNRVLIWLYAKEPMLRDNTQNGEIKVLRDVELFSNTYVFHNYGVLDTLESSLKFECLNSLLQPLFKQILLILGEQND